jgi:hypothetical protein
VSPRLPATIIENGIDHHLAHRGPHLAEAQAHVVAASSRASAYLSSWAVWAGEKRKAGWSRSATVNPVTPQNESSQSNSSDENSESRRQKSWGGSSLGSSTGGRPILSEHASKEDTKPERTSLGKVEPLPENITSQGTVGKTLATEESVNEHKTQEILSEEPRRASVKT